VSAICKESLKNWPHSVMLQTQTCKTAMYTHNASMPILVQLTATLNGVCNSFWAYL